MASKQHRATVMQWLGLTSPDSLWLTVLLAVLLVSGLQVIIITQDNRVAFNELQELREEANQLQVKWGQLLLEQSTFGLEGRIEQTAMNELNMTVPDVNSIVIVNVD